MHYIAAGGTVAIYTRVDDSNPATDRLRYLHKDHLGSVALVTDAAGLIVESRSFDAWGRARNTDWTPSGPEIPLNETKRGFTGHEHLDTVGLIHMNGRVYDPVLGRFVSADPFVQAPANTQSHNRYTYVLNNPLSFTDPSGFGIFDAIGNLFTAIYKGLERLGAWFKSNVLAQSIVQIAAITAFCGFPPGFGCAIGMASGFSAAQTAMAGGNLADMLVAAAQTATFAMMTWSVGEAFFPGVGNELTNFAKAAKTFAHGVVGGVQSIARGGSFRSGFLAGSFAAAASEWGFVERFKTPAGQITAAAVAGGVGSVLGGGKFANGAVTGAFQRLFNDEAEHGFLRRAFKRIGKWLGLGGAAGVALELYCADTNCAQPAFIREEDLRSGKVEIVVPGPRNSRYGKADYQLGNVWYNEDSVGKGGFFRDKLGFSDTSEMESALRAHVVDNFSSGIVTGPAKFKVVGPMTGPASTGNVVSAWQLTGRDRIEFITAFPGPK